MEENNNIPSSELLLGKFLSGNCSPEESEAFLKWLEASEANRELFAHYKTAWLMMHNCTRDQLGKGWDALQQRISEKQYDKPDYADTNHHNKERHLWLFRYVAVFILIMGISAILFFQLNSGDRSHSLPNILEVPLGSKLSLTLPDGTRLWVNSGSKLTYDADFGKNNRDIHLTGEAFFDVAKNKKVPFVVHAGDLSIKALGTQFNIKAYPEDKRIEAILVEGLIEIEKQGLDNGVILKPRQKIVFAEQSVNVSKASVVNPFHESVNSESIGIENETGIFLAHEIDVTSETSWKDGKLVFNREPLVQLTVELARRYDVHFTFSSENLKSYVYTGTFNDLSLEQILEAMRISSPIDFVINEKEVVLKERTE